MIRPSAPLMFFYAPIAQLAEYLTFNQGVGSSSLPWGTIIFLRKDDVMGENLADLLTLRPVEFECDIDGVELDLGEVMSVNVTIDEPSNFVPDGVLTKCKLSTRTENTTSFVITTTEQKGV